MGVGEEEGRTRLVGFFKVLIFSVLIGRFS